MVKNLFVIETAGDLNGTYQKTDCEIKSAANGNDGGEKCTIEEALKQTGHGKFHFFLLCVCGLGMMGVVVENVNVGFVMPYVRCDMGISTIEQGLLNSAGYVGIVMSSHFWGFLADTSGRQNVLKYALGGSYVCAVLSAFATNIMMLTLMRLLVGMFVAGVQAATYSYIGEFHSNATRTKATAFVAMFMPATFVYLPLIAWLIIPMQWEWYLLEFKFTPWRLYLFCSSLLNLFNFVCVCFLPESPKFLLSVGKKTETLAVLRRMYAKNTGNSPEMYPVKDVHDETTGTNLSDVRGFGGVMKLLWNQTWPLFVAPHLGNTFKLCYLMFILFSVGHGTAMWFPDFLTKMQTYTEAAVTLCSVVSTSSIHHLSVNETLTEYRLTNVTLDACDFDSTNTMAFQILLMMGVIFVVISAIVSVYIDRVDRKLLLTTWLLLASAVCLSIAFVRQFHVMVICFMIFLSVSLCAGIISAISVALFPTNYRAMATCLILMFGRIGGVGGSNFVGLLVDVNCDLMFYLYSGLILSCVVICYFLETNPPDQIKTEEKKGGKCGA